MKKALTLASIALLLASATMRAHAQDTEKTALHQRGEDDEDDTTRDVVVKHRRHRAERKVFGFEAGLNMATLAFSSNYANQYSTGTVCIVPSILSRRARMTPMWR